MFLYLYSFVGLKVSTAYMALAQTTKEVGSC